MHAFFVFSSVFLNWSAMVPGVLAETVETGDMNRDGFCCMQTSLVMPACGLFSAMTEMTVWQ